MRNEKGQALILAVMALTLGVLVIVPFLSHAGTALLGSGIYAGEISARDAGDAGVEHAIWSLTMSGLAAQIPNPGDEITYSLPEALNGIVPSIKVSTIAAGGSGGGTPGDIADDIIDTLVSGPTGGNMPTIIPVAGDVYVTAYGDWNNRGWIKTVTIAADGMITDTAIDTLEFDNNSCYEPAITYVSGDYYAIAYRGPNNRGYVKTVSITSAGVIGNSVKDTLIFDSSACYEPDIIHATGNYYAIAYRGNGNSGLVKTISIATSGNIGNNARDTLTFDAAAGYEPNIVFVSGNYYAIAYRGSSNRGYLKTISIATNGYIGNSMVDTYVFNPYSCYYPDIIQVSGNFYAIAYTGSSPANGDWWGGILTTVNINTNGTITQNIISEIVFDPDDGDYADIVHATDNVYAIVYTGGSSQGKMVTVSIDINGAIAGTVLDSLTFETQSGFYPRIIAINNDIYAVTYTGSTGWTGVIKTIGIGSSGSSINSYEIIATAGDTTIRALVNTENITATIISWFVNE